MHYRPLGKTGLSVSEIGYGAWGIGGSVWIGAQEDESVRALHRAIELGAELLRVLTALPAVAGTGAGAVARPVRIKIPGGRTVGFPRPAPRCYSRVTTYRRRH